MAATPSLTRHRRARTPRRWATAQALALALLLLVTQQWGLAHWLQHRSAVASVQGGSATVAADTAGAAAADTAAGAAADNAADTACVTCLALAGLGALGLPQPPAWAQPQAQASAPASGAAPALRVVDATPFRARAPPALS